MKKFIIAVAVAFIPGVALADTVTVTSVTDILEPQASFSSSNTYHFVGTPKVVVKLSGKTCSWQGSGAGQSVPAGCNYIAAVSASTGQILSLSSGNNPGCTPSSNMLAACQ